MNVYWKLNVLLIYALCASNLHSKPTHRIISSLDENIHAQLINELNKVKKGGEIRATYFVFTDPKITQALIAARKRGANVHVTIDAYGQNKKQAEVLHNADVPVRMFNSDGNLGKANLHSKSTLIQHANGSTVVFLGSANASVQSAKNSEIVTITENEDQFYKDNKRYSVLTWNLSHDYRLIKNNEQLPKSKFKNFFTEKFKAELKKTPPNMKLINSDIYDLTMAAFVTRIKNTNPETQKLDLVTYSFNNSAFMTAVRNFFRKGGKGRFITDQSALRDHQRFLTNIADKGALVYVYSPTKRYKSGVSLQHAKILVRHDDTNPLVVISENNPTDEASYDAGKAVLYPGDTNLAKSTTEIINKLITYCNLYVPEPQTSDEELNPNNVDIAQLLEQLQSEDDEENMRALKIMKAIEARVKNKITSKVSAQTTRLYKKK